MAHRQTGIVAKDEVVKYKVNKDDSKPFNMNI